MMQPPWLPPPLAASCSHTYHWPAPPAPWSRMRARNGRWLSARPAAGSRWPWSGRSCAGHARLRDHHTTAAGAGTTTAFTPNPRSQPEGQYCRLCCIQSPAPLSLLMPAAYLPVCACSVVTLGSGPAVSARDATLSAEPASKSPPGMTLAPWVVHALWWEGKGGRQRRRRIRGGQDSVARRRDCQAHSHL